MDEDMAVTDWSKFTVVQLKGILTRRGLDNHGSKEELLQRIEEHEKSEGEINTEELEPEKEEEQVKGLQRKEFVAMRAAMRSLMTVHVKDFKPSTFSEEGFLTWLDGCSGYNFQKNRYGETTTELNFKSVDKGDGAFIDLKTLLNAEVTHTDIATLEGGAESLCNRVLILEGLSASLNTEEKLQEFFPEAEYVYSFSFIDTGSTRVAALEFESAEETNAYLESVGKEIVIDDNKITFHKSQVYFKKHNKKSPPEASEPIDDEERIQLNSEAVALDESRNRLIDNTEIFGTEKIKAYFEKTQRLIELMLHLGPDTRRRVKAGENLPEADDVIWSYTQYGAEQFDLERSQKKITELESEQSDLESKVKQIQSKIKEVFRRAPAEERKNLKVTLASNKEKPQNNKSTANNAAKKTDHQKGNQGNQPNQQNKAAKNQNKAGKVQNNEQGNGNKKRRLNSVSSNGQPNSANKRSPSAGSNDTTIKRKKAKGRPGEQTGQQQQRPQQQQQKNKGAYSDFKKQGAANKQFGKKSALYCRLCDCSFTSKDNQYAHVHGKKHQANVELKKAGKQPQQQPFMMNQQIQGGSAGGMTRKEDLLQGITNVLSEKMKRLEQLHLATMQTQQQIMGGARDVSGFMDGAGGGSSVGMSTGLGSNMGMGFGSMMGSGSGSGMGFGSGVGSGPGMDSGSLGMGSSYSQPQQSSGFYGASPKSNVVDYNHFQGMNTFGGTSGSAGSGKQSNLNRTYGFTNR